MKSPGNLLVDLFRAFSRFSRVMLFLFAFPAFAQGPDWWYARGAVNSNLPVKDYAFINLGQLKWMATNAYLEMEAYFGAGTGVAARVCGFSNSNGNYYLANLGQLKYLAQPFYDRLYALNLTNTFPSNMPGYYPWGGATNTNDFAFANLGQLKYVFSFDSAKDSDGDGLKDWEEIEYGTNPYDADTDDDGLSDGWEVANGYDPLDPSDGQAMLETARQRIIRHWRMALKTDPVFTNAAGSAADLNDMKNALNALSGKFYQIGN
jgi:hypothetical protein